MITTANNELKHHLRLCYNAISDGILEIYNSQKRKVVISNSHFPLIKKKLLVFQRKPLWLVKRHCEQIMYIFDQAESFLPEFKLYRCIELGKMSR